MTTDKKAMILNNASQKAAAMYDNPDALNLLAYEWATIKAELEEERERCSLYLAELTCILERLKLKGIDMSVEG